MAVNTPNLTCIGPTMVFGTPSNWERSEALGTRCREDRATQGFQGSAVKRYLLMTHVNLSKGFAVALRVRLRICSCYGLYRS